MAALARDLRRQLDRTVRRARATAEEGARKALEAHAVHLPQPHPAMAESQRQLRRRLRAHARQLGDRRDPATGAQCIDRLVQECAYEHWHRLLFARFLAEAGLLIAPEAGVAVTLEDARQLAREQGGDWLDLASAWAAAMLPDIFRSGDPALEVALPPETRAQLETLLQALPAAIFAAQDSLGWVYQFWQADRKRQVNRSGVKIGAAELPAVTQLFTEDYMVLFLLHNTLGAWWAGKRLAADPALATSASDERQLRRACALPGVDWRYLRFVREPGAGPWRPAAGAFPGWPRAARDLTLLDPCMGSGHFLVFALPILVALRMAEENLPQEDALMAVLRDNLFGLEIDHRCTQIAAFNLAFAAWRLCGHRPLPPLNLACSGLAIAASRAEWLRLAEQAAGADGLDPRAGNGLATLYDLFAQAPALGSLIDPARAGGDIFSEGFQHLQPWLDRALEAASAEAPEARELAVTAQGAAKAAQLLARRFTLVATNVPFLEQGKQDKIVQHHLATSFADARRNLATAMLRRSLAFVHRGGTAATVTPQNWLFLKTYTKLRERVLRETALNVIAALGFQSFNTQMYDFGVTLNIFTNQVLQQDTKPTVDNENTSFASLDASEGADIAEKEQALLCRKLSLSTQTEQKANPDQRIGLGDTQKHALLSTMARGICGLISKDGPSFFRQFWEVSSLSKDWEFMQTTIGNPRNFGGMSQIVFWQQGKGVLYERGKRGEAAPVGGLAWGKKGVIVSQMGQLPASLYLGDMFDNNAAVVLPHNEEHLPAIWAFCSSPEYNTAVRSIDRALKVTNATLVKVPFDLDHWRQVAAERYPDGLPKPSSDDPTQWLFAGHPARSTAPLQTAVARLLGYRWPRQTGASFMDCPALDAPDGLERHADRDGIVCLAAAHGEAPAHERLAALLADAFADRAAPPLARLLADAGFATLGDWLRDGFFAGHCRLFHNRPFIWHVWDGRRDGFHALVNYHRLAAPAGAGHHTLEKLTYSHLGDWIDRQRQSGSEGAEARLAHAQHLQSQLIAILEGEPPCDLFARWKPLHRQPIGWHPDLDDGVRVNIRPFMKARPLAARAKAACILRTPPPPSTGAKTAARNPTAPASTTPGSGPTPPPPPPISPAPPPSTANATTTPTTPPPTNKPPETATSGEGSHDLPLPTTAMPTGCAAPQPCRARNLHRHHRGMTMPEHELERRIAAGENTRTQFAPALDLAALGKTLCAFANSDGGTLLLGVDASGAIVGVNQEPDRVRERLTDFLQTGCSAPLGASYGRHRHRNRWLHWIEVPRRRGFDPLRFRGRFYIRHRRRNLEPSPSELQELFNTFGFVFTEGQAVVAAGIKDIDLHAFRSFQRTRGLETEQEPQPSLEDDLRNAHVLREVEATLRPTLYGLMTFARDPQAHPQTGSFHIKCTAFAGDDRASDIVLAGEGRGRLDEQVRRALGWFKGLGWRENYRGILREDRPLLPEPALREALVNAVAHRDYAITGTPVMLEVFSDRVAVTSPGALPNHLTVENVRIGGLPRSRNEWMANAMLVARLMESRGLGWQRMRRAMRAFNGSEPELLSPEGGKFVRVTFHLESTSSEDNP